MMNKWQRLHIAVLDCVVDNGPKTATQIGSLVIYTDPQFSPPRVSEAISTLHRYGALIAFTKRRGEKAGEVVFIVNTTQPQKLRAVWRGEPLIVPGDDVSCIVPGTTSTAQ